MTVRTRFAPSPTGFLHIGGARTALFSWADQLEGMNDLSALQFSTQHLVQLINPNEIAETLTLQQQHDFILNLEIGRAHV